MKMSAPVCVLHRTLTEKASAMINAPDCETLVVARNRNTGAAEYEADEIEE
jgi:hypothetical protein